MWAPSLALLIYNCIFLSLSIFSSNTERRLVDSFKTTLRKKMLCHQSLTWFYLTDLRSISGNTQESAEVMSILLIHLSSNFASWRKTIASRSLMPLVTFCKQGLLVSPRKSNQLTFFAASYCGSWDRQKAMSCWCICIHLRSLPVSFYMLRTFTDTEQIHMHARLQH